jgi:hypothetical protein
MRSCVRVSATVFLAALLALPSASAQAQGFFESLFGGGGPPPYAGPAQRQTLPPPVTSPYGYRAPLYSPYRGETRRDDDNFPVSRSGSYRTLCVRMCDGYYWPISHAVNRGSFYRDANVCRASCGEEAKLFYHPSSQGDVSEMVDLTGRAYVKLPTAFRYRKALSDGCKCKPEPWAQSELDRHRRYALNESVDERLKRERLAERVEKPEPMQAEPPRLASLPADKDPDVADPAPFDSLPARQPEPIESPRPRTRRADTRLDSRPAAQPKSTAKGSTIARPAKPAVGGSPFGLGGPSKSRWPGD